MNRTDAVAVARLRAVLRMLVDSGDATPMASRQVVAADRTGRDR